MVPRHRADPRNEAPLIGWWDRRHWAAIASSRLDDSVVSRFSSSVCSVTRTNAQQGLDQIEHRPPLREREDLAIGLGREAVQLAEPLQLRRAKAWQWSLWAALNLHTHLSTLASPDLSTRSWI